MGTRFMAQLLAIAGLACVGEMSSLSGSPCESDLDCPGSFTCAVQGLEGNRTCQPLTSEAPPQVAPPPPEGTPYYCDEVKPLLDGYCNSCHGTNRTPSGVQTMRFDQWTNDDQGVRGAKASAQRIRIRTSDFKDMPPSTSPQPTDEERETIRRWEHAGAPNCQDNPFPPWDEESAASLDGGTSGSNDGGTVSPPTGSDGGSGPISYAQHVQPIWNLYCTGCHNAGTARGNLNLESGVSYAELLNVASACNAGVPLVKAGDANGSMLHRKLVGSGDRCLGVMPPSAALNTFDANAAAVVQQWINEGAKNN